mmetsp:Transcript_233/g.515  ORF Transcript_233/g.515 Transcript_233/m.515 type:complete len:87 (+) Transcript_233:143-403(+)
MKLKNPNDLKAIMSSRANKGPTFGHGVTLSPHCLDMETASQIRRLIPPPNTNTHRSSIPFQIHANRRKLQAPPMMTDRRGRESKPL